MPIDVKLTADTGLDISGATFTLKNGGKFAIDPRTYTNAGTTNPGGHTKFIVPEGYSVKDNTGEDKDEFPYIVSKD